MRDITTNCDFRRARVTLRGQLALTLGLGFAVAACGSSPGQQANASVEVLGAVEFAVDDPTPDSTVALTTTLPAAPTTQADAPTSTVTADPPVTTTAAPVSTTTLAATTTTAPATTTARPVTTTTNQSPTTTTLTNNAITNNTGEARLARVVGEIGLDIDRLLPSWTITAEGPRSGIQALTFTNEHRITVYIRDSHDDDDLRRIVAHELGHALDLTLLDDNSRSQWRTERAISSETPWWPQAGSNDFQTGAGDFAEAVANYLSGRPTLSEVAGPLDDGDRFFISRLLQ